MLVSLLCRWASLSYHCELLLISEPSKFCPYRCKVDKKNSYCGLIYFVDFLVVPCLSSVRAIREAEAFSVCLCDCHRPHGLSYWFAVCSSEYLAYTEVQRAKKGGNTESRMQ